MSDEIWTQVAVPKGDRSHKKVFNQDDDNLPTITIWWHKEGMIHWSMLSKAEPGEVTDHLFSRFPKEDGGSGFGSLNDDPMITRQNVKDLLVFLEGTFSPTIQPLVAAWRTKLMQWQDEALAAIQSRVEQLEQAAADAAAAGLTSEGEELINVAISLTAPVTWLQTISRIYQCYDQTLAMYKSAESLFEPQNGNTSSPAPTPTPPGNSGNNHATGGGGNHRGGTAQPGKKRTHTGNGNTHTPRPSAAAAGVAKEQCNRCGKNHERFKCLFDGTIHKPAHPDVNMERGVAWANSTNGKAWAAVNPKITTLPCRKCLDGSVYVPHHSIPAKKGKDDICIPHATTPIMTCQPVTPNQCVECNHINTELPVTDVQWNYKVMYIKSKDTNCTLPPLRLNALLDSGSLGEGGNYINERIAKELRLRGYKGKPSSKTVCSCFTGDCRKVTNDVFKIKVTFTDPVYNTERSIQLECIEMNTTHDLIVGYETIRL